MDTIKKPFSLDPTNGKIKFRHLDAEEYIKQLQSENSKLQKKIAKLEIDCLTYKSRISGLETEMKKLHKAPPQNWTVTIVDPKDKKDPGGVSP